MASGENSVGGAGLDRAVVIEPGVPPEYSAGALRAWAEPVLHALRAGRRVVLVASAPTWRERADLGAADRLGPAADPFGRAVLLASGPMETAARVSRVLEEQGVRTAVADPRRIAIVTAGHPLEARPRHVDARWFRRALSSVDVAIVPGGVGRDEQKRVTSLGEDGSALSALFLADVLGLAARFGRERVFGRRAQLFARARGIEVPVWAGEEALTA